MLRLQELMGFKQSANDGLAQETKRLEDYTGRANKSGRLVSARQRNGGTLSSRSKRYHYLMLLIIC